jgi:hypothetical protein
MALVNPNIAMGFRQPEFQVPNALAQYAQLQQIQGGQQAQELARFQLGAAQRAETTQNALADAYSSAIEPTGNINYNKLVGLLAKGGGASQIPSVLKTQAETTAAQLAQKKTQGEIDKNQLDLQDKKLKFAWNAVGSATTPEAAIAELNKGVKEGIFDMKSATDEIQRVRSLTPEQYRQYRVEKVMGILDAKDKLGFMLPKTVRQDAGGQILSIQDNPMMPGYGQPIAGAAISKTATIGERTAQGQLNLAQQKFAWEKDNPGFELKEGEDGTFYGVNKRTLQAVPVTVGAVATASVAPTAPRPTALGPRVPVPASQAIPGMTSVLDQQATPAMPVAAPVSTMPVAGTPLRGKGKNTDLSEGERKATTLLQRLQFSQGQLTKALLNDSDAAKPGLFTSALDILSTPAANALKSEARQRVESAQLDILDAALTLGTGASYTKDQLEGYRKSYFPQIGDEPATVKDKKARLDNVISAARISAGKGANLVSNTLPGANPNDPLGLEIGGGR